MGMNWVDLIIAIDAVLIIILAMLQSSKSHGASGAIMGGNSAVFTNVILIWYNEGINTIPKRR